MEHKSSPEASEIVLRLNQYSDIFSDFDIRPYSSRALSVDFLDEIKRASHDKEEGGIELILNFPKKERNEPHELVIKERLTTHFKKHYHLLVKEKHRILKLGITMVILGILCMVAATFVVFKDPSESLSLSFLVVFLEPAAWIKSFSIPILSNQTWNSIARCLTLEDIFILNHTKLKPTKSRLFCYTFVILNLVISITYHLQPIT
jgi:hypothetical protein